MTAARQALVVACLALALVSVSTAQPAEDQRFTLGVMRGDGVMLPFAAYNGRRWSTPWPSGVGAGVAAELPANLEAVPEDWWGSRIPSRWQVWRRGAPPAPFKPVAPIIVPVGRLRRLALRTDYPVGRLTVFPTELPFPKEGVAVGGDVAIEEIVPVSRLAPAGGQLLTSLRADIDEAEERTVKALRSRARWKHPFDARARAAVQPELEAWYNTPLVQPGASVSYIEAVKKYPPQPEDRGCGLETFISGWVHADSRETRLRSQLKAVVTYCDRDTVSYMLPFGQLVAGHRTHWIFQMSGQDHEWYVVAEITPGRSRYVAEYYAGGIPIPR